MKLKTIYKSLSIILLTLTNLVVSNAATTFKDNDNKIILQLEENEVAIFGYGSLMLREQIHAPIDNLYTGPFIQANLRDFKRTWSTRYSNRYQLEFIDENGNTFIPESTTALNAEFSSGSIVNGMIFVCSKSELKDYDERESSYNRIKINDHLENICILGGDAFVYSAKPDHFFPSENCTNEETAIMLYYIDIIEKALGVQGKEFAQEYKESTQALPLHLIFELEVFRQAFGKYRVYTPTQSKIKYGFSKSFNQISNKAFLNRLAAFYAKNS